MNYNPYFDGRRKPREEPVPGEWQYDEHGRKFRKVGNCIEYAPTIQTAHAGTVYVDELPEVQKRMKEQSEQRIKAMQAQAKQEPQGHCPFKEARNNIHTNCDRDCVFFDGSCILASIGRPEQDSKGKYCPIARICRETCALYHGGCTLTCIVKGMKPGKE